MIFISGIIVGILLSLVAILVGKKFSPQISSENMPFDKQEQGYVVKLESDINKLIKE